MIAFYRALLRLYPASFRAEYGDATAYLRAHGVPAAALDFLRAALVEPLAADRPPAPPIEERA